MSQWDLYADYFAGGIPHGEIISSVFIIGLAMFGMWMAKRLYKQL